MIGSIFGLLTRASIRQHGRRQLAGGILRSTDQQYAASINKAVSKLKSGGYAVVIVGESEATLSLVAGGVAALASDAPGNGLRRVAVLRPKYVSILQEMRKCIPQADRHLLLIEDWGAMKPSRLSATLDLLNKFVQAGGALLITVRDFDADMLPSTWYRVRVDELSSRRADALLVWNHLADIGLANKMLPASQTKVLGHRWSGGLAELIEAMDSAWILSARSSRTVVSDNDLDAILRDPATAGMCLRVSEFLDSTGLYRLATDQGVDRVLRLVLAMTVTKALKEVGGNKRRAAALLGIPSSTFKSRARTIQSDLESCDRWT